MPLFNKKPNAIELLEGPIFHQATVNLASTNFTNFAIYRFGCDERPPTDQECIDAKNQICNNKKVILVPYNVAYSCITTGSVIHITTGSVIHVFNLGCPERPSSKSDYDDFIAQLSDILDNCDKDIRENNEFIIGGY